MRMSMLLAILTLSLAAMPSLAQTAAVDIPAGDPMGHDSVEPQRELIARHATIDGVERDWYEYVPASYSGSSPVPLVVAIHGGGADGRWIFKTTSWAQIADKLGFIVIYPSGSIGTDRKLRWNAYPEFNIDPDLALSTDNGVDEAKFVKTVIERTEAEYRIDRGRIYMHGQSNGGMMANYFGLRFPGTLAALAVASAPPSVEVMRKYPVGTPVPLMFWSGENDDLAGQYNPAGKRRAVLNREFADFWLQRDHADPKAKLRLDGPYNSLIYAGDTEVRSTEFRNGVHEIPFTTAYVIWNDFFRRFRRDDSGKILRLVPDAEASPADQGAIALKLGAPLALFDNRLVAVGGDPLERATLVQAYPRPGVIIPASFAGTAFNAKVERVGNRVALTTAKGSANFTVGSRTLTYLGQDRQIDAASRQAPNDVMISLLAMARTVAGREISTRSDVYRHDIYYVSNRRSDISVQTINYLDSLLMP